MTFRVGQKVICIGGFDCTDYDLARHYNSTVPIKNSIYTIAAFHDPRNFIELVEITAPPPANYVAFATSRFRPLASRETSIEFAHEILRSTSQKVDA